MLLTILGPAPPDRGGIAHETSRLAAELSRRTAVRYFTFSRPYPRWLDPRRFDRDPELSAAPAEPVLDYLSPLSWRTAAERIAAERPAALIVPWWTSFWALPIRAVFRRLRRASPPIRRVLLCHNLEDHEGGLLRNFLTAGALSGADAFLVHSDEDREILARRFQRPVEKVPLPALPGVAGKAAARERLGVGGGRIVLFLGLVRRYKGVATLIEAAPRIVDRSGARIAIVGEVFPDARELAEQVRSSPAAASILWHDRYVSEEEMDLWLAACDAVVLPYRKISGSAIAARAIGAHRPIAAARIGGLKDVVLPGDTGELFSPGDAAGLAQAVERILERGEGAYEPGLSRAADSMAWPRYAERISGFIRSLGNPPGILARPWISS